jgi:hypothetical protein
LVQNTAGAWVRLESSAATFTNPGGTNSQWIWALGAGPWTNLSPSPRSAQFIY